MRMAHAHHRRQFDVVISCDNSITHLLDDDDLLLALRQMYDCTRPGGGCLLTVRDYDREESGTGLIKPYGVREENGKRYVIFQVWDFAGDLYDLAMYFVVDDRSSDQLITHVMRTRYNAIGTDRLLALMREAGFTATGAWTDASTSPSWWAPDRFHDDSPPTELTVNGLHQFDSSHRESRSRVTSRSHSWRASISARSRPKGYANRCWSQR